MKLLRVVTLWNSRWYADCCNTTEINWIHERFCDLTKAIIYTIEVYDVGQKVQEKIMYAESNGFGKIVKINFMDMEQSIKWPTNINEMMKYVGYLTKYDRRFIY